MCQLDYSSKGSNVKLSGNITGMYVHEGNVFFTLSDNGCEIKTVLWSSTIDEPNRNISNGENVSVMGMVDSYKGELEIIAKSVERILV